MQPHKTHPLLGIRVIVIQRCASQSAEPLLKLELLCVSSLEAPLSLEEHPLPVHHRIEFSTHCRHFKLLRVCKLLRTLVLAELRFYTMPGLTKLEGVAS